MRLWPWAAAGGGGCSGVRRFGGCAPGRGAAGGSGGCGERCGGGCHPGACRARVGSMWRCIGGHRRLRRVCLRRGAARRFRAEIGTRFGRGLRRRRLRRCGICGRRRFRGRLPGLRRRPAPSPLAAVGGFGGAGAERARAGAAGAGGGGAGRGAWGRSGAAGAAAWVCAAGGRGGHGAGGIVAVRQFCRGAGGAGE